jgi:6-phosphogluconolactonase
MQPQIRIVADNIALTRTAAEIFVRWVQEAAQKKEVVTVALSGGSTPKSLYAMLVNDGAFRTQIPWDKVHFFWGDERHVPPDHPESNYRMANEAMLSQVPVPASHVHRIQAENANAGQAAEEYERTLQAVMQTAESALPRFDVVLLGMGPDGHTASLFPGTTALKETRRLVVANWVEKFSSYRITLTLPVLNNADHILFIVGGADKAETLQAVLEGDQQTPRFPAQLIRPTHGSLVWLVDQAAASHLRSVSSSGSFST